MSFKKWIISVVLVLLCFLLLVSGTNICIDPYFHYHSMVKGITYLFPEERYGNDGILRHFDYDAVITGTSMSQNFMVSEANSLFGANFVKVCSAGASFKETDQQLRRGFAYNKKIRFIIRGLDFGMLKDDKDHMYYSDLPEYLYDSNTINDVNYILNKDVFFDSIRNIIGSFVGKETTTFDKYSNWNNMKGIVFGKEEVLKHRTKDENQEMKSFSQEEQRTVEENIEQNIVEVVKENPDTEFYYYFTPYSIVALDNYYRAGTIVSCFEAERYAAKLMLEYDNIHLFSFWEETDTIGDLDNYRDTDHYGEWINSWILEQMKEGTHQLLKETYNDYYDSVIDMYLSFDYGFLAE